MVLPEVKGLYGKSMVNLTNFGHAMVLNSNLWIATLRQKLPHRCIYMFHQYWVTGKEKLDITFTKFHRASILWKCCHLVEGSKQNSQNKVTGSRRIAQGYCTCIQASHHNTS